MEPLNIATRIPETPLLFGQKAYLTRKVAFFEAFALVARSWPNKPVFVDNIFPPCEEHRIWPYNHFFRAKPFDQEKQCFGAPGREQGGSLHISRFCVCLQYLGYPRWPPCLFFGFRLRLRQEAREGVCQEGPGDDAAAATRPEIRGWSVPGGGGGEPDSKPREAKILWTKSCATLKP